MWLLGSKILLRKYILNIIYKPKIIINENCHQPGWFSICLDS